MSTWVLDCSVASALFLKEDFSKISEKFFNELKKTDKLIVPSLWWIELTNVINFSIKRKLLSHQNLYEIISTFESFEIETFENYGSKYLESIFALTQKYQLTAYDAAYLNLALKEDCFIATHDKALKNSAIQAGIKVYEN